MSRKLTIEQMQALAAQYGGKCISSQYVSNSTELEWECKDGHRFFKQPVKVRVGQWCMDCSGHVKKYTIKDAIETASLYGGKLQTTDFQSGSQKLEWVCKSGHYFEKSLIQIKHRNSFCSKCNVDNRGKTQRLGIELMRQIANDRGGECLSDEYLSDEYHDAHTVLKWKCIDGHTWEAHANSIISSNSWCPECKKYINFTEERCRFIFEKLTGKHFGSNRGVITGFELDGYNKELKLAFEHHGKQHFDYDPFFHQNNKGLEGIINRDNTKIQKCKEEGIRLIIIPYTVSMDDKTLIEYIVEQLEVNGVYLKQGNISEITFDGFYHFISRLNQLKKIASEYEGKLLSDQYCGNKTKHHFACKNGHDFYKRPNDVKSYGQWCPECKKVLNNMKC
ncbi:hypothetical protein [Brevibacillus reuszeri]|uniref:hypothetical protein n=1 Tax=Brevibacillus reuszeri TaxID=54915 RepID=UPI003D20810B